MRVFLILFLSFNVWATTTDQIIHVPVNAIEKSSMTEKRFMEILDWFYAQYVDEIKARGAKLKIIPDWPESMANAFAQREEDTWIIRVLGGMARHPAVTEDAFILVLCHEMGHHIGGAPKKKDFFSTSWASDEGQADYWATLKCTRKIWEQDDNQMIIATMDIPKTLETECDKSFSDKNESALCKRVGMASLSHARFLNRRDEIHTPVSFDTPSTREVRRTNHKHPKPQCRLDITFQASICPINYQVDVSSTDASIGTCHELNGHDRGKRPRCWYRFKP